MSAPVTKSVVHGLTGKCPICHGPLEQIVSCTMDRCPIPEPTDDERRKLLEMLKEAAR